MKVVIDTNVLFQLLKNDIDFSGLNIVIPDFIIEEFVFKAKEYKVKNLDLFLEKLKKNFKIEKTTFSLNKNADELLIKFCKMNDYALLTIDKKLKKRAQKENIKIINLRKGKYVEEDYLNYY